MRELDGVSYDAVKPRRLIPTRGTNPHIRRKSVFAIKAYFHN